MPPNQITSVFRFSHVWRGLQEGDEGGNSGPSDAVGSPSFETCTISLVPDSLSKLILLWVGGGSRGLPEVPSNMCCPLIFLCGTGAAVFILALDSVPPEGNRVPHTAFHINGSRTRCAFMVESGNWKVSLKKLTSALAEILIAQCTLNLIRSCTYLHEFLPLTPGSASGALHM